MKKKILRFEITDKCNQRCKMCWSTDWKHTDMEWKNIEKIILDYAKNFPNGTIVLTSREPLLSLSFENILKLTKKLGIEIKLLTNGILLNKKNCELIVNSTVNFISISIHGDEKLHNKIVNCSNSYKKTLDGIKMINLYKKKYNRNDLDIRITTVVNDKLFDNIDEIINICNNYETNLRIQHMMWHNKNIKEEHKKIMKQRFDYDDNIIDGFLEEVNIDPYYIINTINKAKEICRYKQVDLQVYPNLSDEDIINWYSGEESLKCNETYYCDHVEESIRMRANGDITLCQYIDKFYGNAVKNNFEHFLSSQEYKNISEELLSGKLFPICYHCCHLRKKHKSEEKNNFKI